MKFFPFFQCKCLLQVPEQQYIQWNKYKRVQPDIEAVYAFGEHPRTYYVESSRRYRLLGQTTTDCEALAFGTAWFARDGRQVRELDSGVDLLGCNRRGASYMLPLGVIRAQEKSYWLAPFSGFVL